MATAADVAAFMVELLQEWRELRQDDAAIRVQAQFGDEFVYYNNNGNLALHKAVLDAFRKASGENVVWLRNSRYWRYRQPGDESGRMQPW